MSKQKSLGDARWIISHGAYKTYKERVIAWSTYATENEICILANNCRTMKELQEKLHNNPEAVEVLQKYIDNGYGDTDPNTMFYHPDYSQHSERLEKGGKPMEIAPAVELLPCPHCGSGAKIEILFTGKYQVTCKNKKCSAICTGSKSNRKTCDLWNRRT